MHTPRHAAAALAAVTAYMQQEAAARRAAPRLIPADTYNHLYALYLQLRPLFEGR